MKREKGKRPTINDIVKASGYSKTTISFAFNDPSRIKDETRNKILKIAEELGYYPDPLARNFSLHTHFSIGFLLPQNINYSMGNPYIMEVVRGISSVCQIHGFNLVIIPPVKSSVIEAVKSAPVDGIISMGMGLDNEIIKIMKRRRIPFVAIDGNPCQEIPSVNIDDEKASYEIMKEVLNKGHRKIAIISLSRDLFTVYEEYSNTVPHQRKDGYLKALQEVDLDFQSPDIQLLVSECTFNEGKKLADMLRPDVTCAICMSDIVAIGLLYELRSRHIEVPEQLSVVGFDNLLESKFISPRLTTVNQPGFEKGEIAADLLFKYIRGEIDGVVREKVPYGIVIRESLGINHNI